MIPMLPVYDSTHDHVRFVDNHGDHWRIMCEDCEPNVRDLVLHGSSATYRNKPVSLKSDQGKSISQLTTESIDLLKSVFDLVKTYRPEELPENNKQVVILRRDTDSKYGILLETSDQNELDRIYEQSEALRLDVFLVENNSKSQKQKILTPITKQA